mgnify:FL=1
MYGVTTPANADHVNGEKQEAKQNLNHNDQTFLKEVT